MENCLAENLAEIKNGIMEGLEKSGRSGESVEILCASKNRSISELFDLKKLGIECFGENKVQELLSKYDESLTWDFIGRLQTNKVKYIVSKVRLIQSLDRLSLAEEIEKQAEKHDAIQKCLVEINSGSEETKGGLLLPEVDDFVAQMENFPHIQICGLMAVAPKSDEETLKRLFSEVAEKYHGLRAKYQGFDYLSMGMSADYKIAVECGSNMIRPGKLFFK